MQKTYVEEIYYSLYSVNDNYGVIVATPHGLLETTLPSVASREEILAALHQRYTLPCGENNLTRSVAERLYTYFSGSLVDFDFPIDKQRFTAFQCLTYQSVHAIGYGMIKTYGEIAREIQRPRAARGVGSAMARNPLPIIIPCHRVIGTSGAMTGYSATGGVRRKELLLRMEAEVLQKLNKTETEGQNKAAHCPSY